MDRAGGEQKRQNLKSYEKGTKKRGDDAQSKDY